MTFIEKLDLLMKEREINKSTLAKESGIPLSTILSWYDPNKGYENIRVSTLKSLVNYFKCSYDFLADENITPDIQDLSDEKTFMRLWDNTSHHMRNQLLRKIVDLTLRDKK